MQLLTKHDILARFSDQDAYNYANLALAFCDKEHGLLFSDEEVLVLSCYCFYDYLQQNQYEHIALVALARYGIKTLADFEAQCAARFDLEALCQGTIGLIADALHADNMAAMDPTLGRHLTEKAANDSAW